MFIFELLVAGCSWLKLSIFIESSSFFQFDMNIRRLHKLHLGIKLPTDYSINSHVMARSCPFCHVMTLSREIPPDELKNFQTVGNSSKPQAYVNWVISFSTKIQCTWSNKYYPSGMVSSRVKTVIQFWTSYNLKD